ncbi:MAG: UDP-N-acetylmuramoyl-L-alanine--D-glutamate ligase [Bdellovibrionales bacterium]
MIDLHVFKKALNEKPVAVFGLGLSGLGSVGALIAAGIDVIAWDDNAQARDKAAAMGAVCKNLDKDVLKQCAYLLLSPGVPLTHPAPHDVVKSANAAGIKIIGDIEILGRCDLPNKTIAITGTNGKSTTTALLTHTLNACGKSAVMGGNVGVPVLKMDMPKPDTIIVLEMSSYQIDLCPTFAPDIAVLLNITPDHIDRHGSFENYAAIKHRLLDNAKCAINVSSLHASSECVQSMDDTDKPCHDESLGGHVFPTLPGDHNKQNIIAVLNVCEALGVETVCAITAIKTFPGLAHRQYLVREIGGVKYINDSKATNAEAAAKALSAYENIHWILGGQAKDGGLKGLEPFMSRVKKAYLIGAAAQDFSRWLKKQNVPHQICEVLDVAVKAAHDDAQIPVTRPPSTVHRSPSTVLLSPACASWDQFKSFEHRGDTFVKLVEAL